MSEQLEFFLLEFLLFLICVGSSVAGAYFPGHKMWVQYTNNCVSIFKLKNLPFIIKEYKYKYVSWFVFFTLFNCLALSMFLWIWFNVTKDIYQGENILLFIPFIIVFLLSDALIFILFKKFWNEIKEIGIYSKKEAVETFKKFQSEIKFKNIKSFQIIGHSQNTIQDYPFQFQQRNYQRKIKKLINKKTNEEKYDIKLITLFNNYLKIYAIFIKRISKEKYDVIIENSEQSIYFPDIIINNFFAYVNQAQKEFSN
ncbi:hypothetical protein [Spiroplasma platyhelix]|uniref:Transmembrane protein n=1 Tax=Spiroplasma platyhelix PALS-1 TaxID=1276218 RepID=A0A846TWG9_9MOLU|nr:hypothetical protein [Spiroplasma platyhelix]MBE4704151.1 hypothetical protein [Spiroplasma platyhelix PALS-1]NKE38522.1 hypothetical protein [Spiroplasma platyhelix PALS-1]UJB29409.1 hypothetical protein SPLAT_v1c06450 [Spiroplasma platyhelix PALS-1]